jgi:hypothetical protein
MVLGTKPTRTSGCRSRARTASARSSSTTVALIEHTASPLDFVGDLDATIALLGATTESAHALLADGLVLAPQDVASHDGHPLLLVMGRQRNVRLACAPVGIDYFEFILAVPFVEPAGSRGAGAGPFGYMPCLLLDRWLPTVAGRILLAYEKHRAVLFGSEDSYRVVSAKTGERLLAARHRPSARSESYRLPVSLRRALELPVISRRAGGGWRYTVADLRLDEARIEPLEMNIAIERPFVPGLPAGKFVLDAGGGRAVRLRTSWRLTGPFARRSPLRSRTGQSSAETVT